MKRVLGIIPLALMILVSVASAQGGPTHPKGALGFHTVEAPLGVRWWLTPKVALDAGLGVGSDDVPGLDESLSHWALDVGLPYNLKSFDKLHFMLRPGILYESEEEIVDPGPPVNKDSSTYMTISFELEAEYFLSDHFSVSAAHGLAFVNTNPAGGGDSFSNWGTTGSNFTNVGFHVYIFGEK